MADDVLARATVAVSADLKNFDAAMALLPEKSQKAIKKSIDAIKAEMAKVGQAIGTANNLADVQKLSDYYGKLQKSLEGVQKSAITQAASMGVANRAMDEVGKAAGLSGNKMQVFAQTLDDLQYVPEQGLRPILNNLIQISPALGVAGLVLQQFISHWDDLAKLFGQGRVKTQAEEMEELGKKTEKTAQETERLLNYETQRKNLDAQRGPTDAQSETTGRVNAAIRNSGEGAVRDAINVIHGPAIQNSIDQNLVENLDKANKRVAAAQERSAALDANPNAHPENRERARWDLERMREKLEEAQKAWNTAYAEGRDKIQGNLSGDLKALKLFIADAEKRKLLTPAALERLRQAAKSPEEIDIEEQNALDAKEVMESNSRTAEREEAARVRERDDAIASEEYYRKQDEEHASRSAGFDEGKRNAQLDKDQARVAPLQDKLVPNLLEQIARGQDVNQEKLASTIQEKIAGLGVKDPASVASNLAAKTKEDLDSQIAKRQLEKGGTREEAATAMFGEKVKQLRDEAQANRPSYGVTDIESFHREATDSLLKGNSTEALISEQKRATDAYVAAQKQSEELVKALKEKRGHVLKDP